VADVASVECDQVITHGAYSKLNTLVLAMGTCDHDDVIDHIMAKSAERIFVRCQLRDVPFRQKADIRRRRKIKWKVAHNDAGQRHVVIDRSLPHLIDGKGITQHNGSEEVILWSSIFYLYSSFNKSQCLKQNSSGGKLSMSFY